MKKSIPTLAILMTLAVAACTYTAPNGAATNEFVDTTSLRTLDARAAADTAEGGTEATNESTIDSTHMEEAHSEVAGH